MADKPHGASDAAGQYEVDGHNEVNKVDPLKAGEAIFYRGLYFDDCARTDDPQGRWKAGDLVEFKGPRLGYLLNRFEFAQDKLDNEALSRERTVEGTGRKVKYLFAESEAANRAGELLKRYSNIKVFHFPPVTPVPSGRTRKGLDCDGDGA